MLNRRSFLLGCGATTTGLLGSGAPVLSAEPDVRACRPADPLRALQQGNARFAAAWQASNAATTDETRAETMAGLWQDNCYLPSSTLQNQQAPWASVLCCADSRVSPEWIFDAVPSDLFVIRSAGNTAFNEAIASLEYAVSVLETPLILVMGHSRCGAIMAARSPAPLTPLLEELVAPIRANRKPGDTLEAAIRANARNTADQLTEESALLANAVATRQLTIRSAYFDIGTGTVSMI